MAFYEQRADAGLGVFTGQPPTDAVSVHELAREAEEEAAEMERVAAADRARARGA